jgi:hypothetical protein
VNRIDHFTLLRVELSTLPNVPHVNMESNTSDQRQPRLQLQLRIELEF